MDGWMVVVAKGIHIARRISRSWSGINNIISHSTPLLGMIWFWFPTEVLLARRPPTLPPLRLCSSGIPIGSGLKAEIRPSCPRPRPAVALRIANLLLAAAASVKCVQPHIICPPDNHHHHH